MMEVILKQYNLNAKNTIMVGDRLDTDIKFGIDSGVSTLLTLTGITKKDTLFSSKNPIIPEYFIDSVSNLFD